MTAEHPRPKICAVFFRDDGQVLLTNSGDGPGFPVAPIAEGQATETVLASLAKAAVGAPVGESRFLGMVDVFKPEQVVLLCFACRVEAPADDGLGTVWMLPDEAGESGINAASRAVLAAFGEEM